MDVLALEPLTNNPIALVEGYTSMIWAERYLGSGEFEMKTAQIDATRALIPEGTLISLRDSLEVMIVESSTIAFDDDIGSHLTVKGRSFDTFSENRCAVDSYNKPWLTLGTYTTSEIAAFLLWNHLVNTTGEDPSRTAQVQDSLGGIPRYLVADATTVAQTARQWWLDEGDRLAPLQEFLALANLGVRTVRPNSSRGNVVQFDTSRTASRGVITKTDTNNITWMRTEIYNGIDRTRFQTRADVEPVIFHFQAGHLERPQYLFSIRDYRNTAIVSTPYGNLEVSPGDYNSPPATVVTNRGLDRRVLYVDAGTPGDQTFAVYRQSAIQKGVIELAKHNRASLFDAAISLISPYKYGVQYFLGDKVTLLAQYGLESSMQVVEYVRTEDQDGDRGYPTLILAL